MEERTTLVNCGLGDKFDETTMYSNPKNPGGNSVINYDKDNQSTETIKIAPLDYLLAEARISPAEVKYIWIDTECFEAQVLLGAKNLLAQTSAPIFVKFNLGAWKNSGLLDKMIDLLTATGYKHFISVEKLLDTGEEKIYPLERIDDFAKFGKGALGQYGDIFLIKNL